MRRVALITGVCGFSGRHLVRYLPTVGDFRLVGLDLCAEPTDLALDDYLRLDLRDPRQAEDAIRRAGPDLVFHLAGLLRGTSTELNRTNLLGGLSLLDAALRLAPETRVLVVGSAAEYGPPKNGEIAIAENCPCNPVGPYANSKFALTMTACDYARQRGLRVVVARPFNLVGQGTPPSLLVGAIVRQMKSAVVDTEPVRVGNLQSKRDFLSVTDAVRVYLRLLEGDHWGQIFNICSGRPIAVQFIVERLLSLCPRPRPLEVDPSLIRDFDPPCVYGSFQKAADAFGFRPEVPLDEALKEAWFDDQGTSP